MAIIALLVIVAVVAVASVRGFASPITLTFLLLDVMPILLIALPMTLIIITGEIDLSVASIAGLASVLTGVLTRPGSRWRSPRSSRSSRERSAACSTASSSPSSGCPRSPSRSAPSPSTADSRSASSAPPR